MWSILYNIKSKARTVSGINAAIEKETGDSEPFFIDQKDLDSAIKEGFIEFTKSRIIVYQDGI